MLAASDIEPEMINNLKLLTGDSVFVHGGILKPPHLKCGSTWLDGK